MENIQQEPLISVIIPVYNIMDYLPRCVDSVLAQTYPGLEIVLVDDGSTDGTGKLCDRLAQKDERIRVFHKENGYAISYVIKQILAPDICGLKLFCSGYGLSCGKEDSPLAAILQFPFLPMSSCRHLSPLLFLALQISVAMFFCEVVHRKNSRHMCFSVYQYLLRFFCCSGALRCIRYK